MLHLFDRVVDAGGRQRAHADDAIRRRRAVFLAEKLVVGADTVAVKVIVLGLAQNESDLRKKNFAVDAVLILFGQALLWRARAGAGFEGRDLLGEVDMSDAYAAGNPDRIRLAAVDHHGVGTVGHFDALRSALAKLRLHAIAPDVGVQIDMSVGGNALILTRHGGILSRAYSVILSSRVIRHCQARANWSNGVADFSGPNTPLLTPSPAVSIEPER